MAFRKNTGPPVATGTDYADRLPHTGIGVRFGRLRDLSGTALALGAVGAKRGVLYTRPQERSRDAARRRRSNRPGNSQAKGPRALGHSGKQRLVDATSRSPKE
jgi:hypothetical protein